MPCYYCSSATKSEFLPFVCLLFIALNPSNIFFSVYSAINSSVNFVLQITMRSGSPWPLGLFYAALASASSLGGRDGLAVLEIPYARGRVSHITDNRRSKRDSALDVHAKVEVGVPSAHSVLSPSSADDFILGSLLLYQYHFWHATPGIDRYFYNRQK